MRNYKILHFEDNPMLSAMYQVAFTKKSFEYKHCENPPKNAEKLINLVLAEKPDLIIMDIIMPGLDGFRATKYLNGDDRTKNIPIIGFSNNGRKEDIDQLKSFGIKDYFINSVITPTELVERVKQFLHIHNKKILN